VDHQSRIHGELMISYGTRTLADILSLHGYRQDALAYRTSLAAEYPVTAYRHWHSNQMIEIDALRTLKQPVKGVERWLLANELHLRANTFGGDPFLAVDTQIKTFFDAGETEKAIRLLHQMNPNRTRFHELAVDLFEEEYYTHPDLELILIRLLEDKREKGLKIHEPRLYVVYAGWLADQGRWQEALSAQLESMRLYDSLQIPNRALAEHAVYLTYLYAAGLDDLLIAEQEKLRRKQDRHGEPLPDWIRERIATGLAQQGTPAQNEQVQIPVDLQPTQMQTVTLPGAVVRTRFTLSNPSQNEQTGILKTNPPALWTERADDAFELSWLNPEKAREEQLLTLPPFSQKSLYLVAPLPAEGKTGSIDLSWVSNPSGKTDSATWTFSQGDQQKDLAFTNASRLQKNPFYLVPVYQSLVRKQTGEAEEAYFRIVCNSPTRVEVYRESDQQLIYVDNNGDGDLDDSGDILFADENKNNLPEVAFAPGEDLLGLVIYLLPPAEQKETIEIEVSLLQDGAWAPQTVHLLEP
jgi:hypothetical protein